MSSPAKLNQGERQHGYLLNLAGEAERHLHDPMQKDWLEREHSNYRASLLWSQSPARDHEQGLRLAVALWQFWWLCGHAYEGRQWLQEALANAGAAAQPNLRAWALLASGALGMDYFSYAGYLPEVPHLLL